MARLLESRRGRLFTFFGLYVTEGIPQGFTSIAVATYMRRQGLTPAQVGMFVGSLYLPWAWKWLMGPIVDLVYWDRVGRRRGWIILCQAIMILTLLMAMPINFGSSSGLRIFVGVILLHNVFAAWQDVAIDALAVSVLKPEEQGTANGLMFAGAYSGNALGGAGVLLLLDHIRPFAKAWTMPVGFVTVAAMLAGVSALITWRLQENRTVAAARLAGESAMQAATREAREYIFTAFKSFFGSVPAFAGLIFALFPAGAYALSLSIGTNLAVELGLSDSAIGLLTLIGTIEAAVMCVVGGWLSDKLGRRKMISIFIASMSIPTLYMAWVMIRHHYIMPVDPTTVTSGTIDPSLVTAFWVASLGYGLGQGLMYGTRTALFMNITNPKVAATQFTAYMATLNLVIAYSAWWQGKAASAWGYPKTLMIDAVFGLVGLAALPWMRPVEREAEPEPEPTPLRAFPVIMQDKEPLIGAEAE